MNSIRELNGEDGPNFVLFAKDDDSTRVFFDRAEIELDETTNSERLLLYRVEDEAEFLVGATDANVADGDTFVPLSDLIER